MIFFTLKTGIPDKNLFIALEPEAASVYCQYLPTEKLYGAETGFVMSKPGTKYMIVDLGGNILRNYNELSYKCEVELAITPGFILYCSRKLRVPSQEYNRFFFHLFC